MGKIQYGLQLYSLRELAKQDLEAAIRTAAEQGYAYVEFAGFHGHPAETVKEWLDRYGVRVVASHQGIAGLKSDVIDDTVKNLQTIGCDTYVVAWMDIATREILDENIAIMNAALPKLKAAGITLTYHNHSQEFIKTPYGAMVHEELQSKTELDFELDTYWLHFVGLDPVSVMKQLKSRVRLIHLRDGIPPRYTEDGKAIELSVGEGNTPIREIREAAIAMEMTMIVESPGQKPTGPDETKRCIDFLRTLD